MHHARQRLGVAAALVLLLGVLGVTPAPAQEPATETLTVYGAVCPTDYAGDD